MQIELPAEVRFIIRTFEEHGFEAYCVGGCVRDSLMGHSPADWDLTCSAKPEETKALFSDQKLVENGLKHGTVSVVLSHKMFEITTFRVDGVYKDNRRPESVAYTKSLVDDLSRRDFTINAMAYSEKSGLVDLFGGENDLKAKLIRTVGDPETRFAEDGLRLMRALRFSAVLGFQIDEKTALAVHGKKQLLRNISAERLQAELVRLITGENAFSVLISYPDVLSVFIPEIAPTVGFRQYGEKHAYDVWTHICHTVEGVPPDRVLRLAMLLHDLGKVPTHKRNERGESTFKDHAAVGAVMAETILLRLRFDRKTVSRVCFLIAHHDMELPADKIALKKLLKTMQPDDIRDLLLIKTSDRGALSEKYRNISPEVERIQKWLSEIEENGDCCSLRQLAIDGNVLKKAGLEGSDIKDRLELLLDAVIDGKVENTRGALLTYNAQ